MEKLLLFISIPENPWNLLKVIIFSGEMDLASEKRRRRCKTRRRRHPHGHDGKTVPVPSAEACDSGKRASFPPKSTSSSDDEKFKRFRMKDSLKVESLIVIHSLKQ